jgi:hypothetical protein
MHPGGAIAFGLFQKLDFCKLFQLNGLRFDEPLISPFPFFGAILRATLLGIAQYGPHETSKHRH